MESNSRKKIRLRVSPGSTPEQYSGSHEEIASILNWIAPDCIKEFLRVVTFCIVSGNGDAHLKNFSVLYRDGRTAALSPAYDLVATIAYFAPGREKLALKLGSSDRLESFTLHRFSSLFRVLAGTTNKAADWLQVLPNKSYQLGILRM